MQSLAVEEAEASTRYTILRARISHYRMVRSCVTRIRENGPSLCTHRAGQHQDLRQDLRQDLHRVVAKTTRQTGGAQKVIHVRLTAMPATAHQMDNLGRDGGLSGDASKTLQTVRDAQLWMPAALVVVAPTDNQFRSKCSRQTVRCMTARLYLPHKLPLQLRTAVVVL